MASNDVIMRLRMMGAATFQAAASGAAKSVREIGAAADDTQKKGGGLNNVLGKMEGPMGKIGSLTATAGKGLAAAGVAAAGMGIKFNAGMEQSRTAFTNLLGNSRDAQAMLDRLYTIAAKTPFEFPQLTQATQRLI